MRIINERNRRGNFHGGFSNFIHILWLIFTLLIMEPIRNKVAESGILTLDLAPFTVPLDSIYSFDLKPFLFREMILKEKDFREAMKAYDFETFKGKDVAVYCSVDAIIPVWAFMLSTTYIKGFSKSVHFGMPEVVATILMHEKMSRIDLNEYADKRVVLKGCGETPVPEAAYVYASSLLSPLVKSLMYGEPCSTVPIYKRPISRPIVS